MNRRATRALPLAALTREAFAPFGQLIGADGAAPPLVINDGTALRFDALGEVQTDSRGRAGLSLFRAQPRALPFELQRLERHPLGSQAFVPLDPRTRYVVVVAGADRLPVGFLAEGSQGINIARGIWHHPLIALDRVSDFVVIDRIGAGENCEEADLADGPWQLAAPG